MTIGRGPLLVLALTASVFLVQVYGRPLSLSEGRSQQFNLTTALLETGTFAAGVPPAGKPAVPTRDVAPGYTALVAALAKIDPRIRDSLICLARQPKQCPAGYAFGLVIAVQALATIAMFGVVFLIARTLSGSQGIAATTTLLTLAAGRFAEFTRMLFPYAIVTALSVFACYLLLVAYRRQSLVATAAAGLVIGATAMFDSAYASLVWLAAALIGFSVAIGTKSSWHRGAAFALALIIGGHLATAPWQLRNWSIYGDPAIAVAEPASRLAERVSYNQMGPPEFAAALIAWLPGFGDGLSAALFSEVTLAKIANYVPSSYLLDRPAILDAAHTDGRSSGSEAAIIKRFVLGDLAGYLISLVPLMLRGLWATGSIFVIWGVVLMPQLVRRLAGTETLAPFVVASGPLFLMALVQALVTPNFPWMNLGLVFVYAYAIAYVTGGVELPASLRRI